MIGDKYLANIVAEYLKVCVALFLVLSGYGLNASMNKNKYSITKFYKKHIWKIYKNYWLIWILFVPIGVIRGRTFSFVYGDHYLAKLLTDILGLQKLLGYNSYNATWWFITLILGLYLIFPIIYKLAKKVPLLLLIAGGVAMFLPVKKIANLDIILTYKFWLLPFIFGVLMSEYKFIKRKNEKLNAHAVFKFITYFTLLFLAIYIRKHGKYLINLRIDTLFSFAIILISLEYIKRIKMLNRFLKFVGNHSFNIFLFHTFIYGMYFREFVYSLKHPLLIWLSLLLMCLNISVLIEKLKLVLVNYYLNRIIPIFKSTHKDGII